MTRQNRLTLRKRKMEMDKEAIIKALSDPKVDVQKLLKAVRLYLKAQAIANKK